MKRLLSSLSFLFAFFIVLSASFLSAQQQENQELGADPGFRTGSIEHMVFGDLVIDESSAPTGAPQNFTVSLNSSTGLPFGRDSIAPNGRFRFQNIPNGEYTLVVEGDGKVLYRERFILNERRSTDVRKNVELAWKERSLGASQEGGILYARTTEHQKLFDEAEELAKKGQLKDAISRLERVTKEDSEDFEAWSELGTFYFRHEDYKKAEKAYQQALEEKPDFLVAMSNLGKVRLAQEEFVSAVEALEQAIELDPARAELNRLLGEGYLGMKKGSTAVGYLNKAIELDPDGMADVHLRLAQLYDLAGYKNMAAQEYSRYLSKRPDDSRKNDLQKYIEENGN